jgi:NAD(P)H dehydrogenase (quinone)
VDLKRVPETVPADVFQGAGGKVDQAAAIAQPAELANYDAIIFGAPTRFGNVSAQMRNFIDQTGGLWFSGALVGKVGSVFTSSATQHGGQESTILTFIPTLLHHGMVVVGLPYAEQRQMGLDEIKGGSPYGASTITGGQGERMPSEQELGMAQFQGKHVAAIATKLFG